MRLSQKGFSLIEVMVAMVIGMVSMVVIMQVFYVSEGRKRSTTGGADAQSNAAIAFYMIERDTKMAGWGISGSAYSGCNTTFSYCDGSPQCGGGIGSIGGLKFASVQAADGGATGPDSLTASYFANPTLDTYRYPSTTVITSPMPQSSSEFNVATVHGCEANDMALVSDGGQCTLMQVTHVQGEALKIQHNPGGNAYFNPTINYQKDHGWPAYKEGARVSCFKAPPNGALFQRTYYINADRNQLQRDDNTQPVPVAGELVAPEIVDFQVQYGLTVANKDVIDTWTDPTGIWADPPMAVRMQIKAVRIVMVSRSTQYEKPEKTGQVCNATDENEQLGPAWANIVANKERFGANYRCYRYKVLETVVPLRNVIWANL